MSALLKRMMAEAAAREKVAQMTVMNPDAVIAIARGRSDEGGFDYAQMRSAELTEAALWKLGNQLREVGGLRRVCGYEIVAKPVIDALGERFTVAQLQTWIADRQAAMAQVKMVRCDCGHTVPAAQVMTTSRGTSCPDCYDHMSA